jgi:hypothetical protein
MRRKERNIQMNEEYWYRVFRRDLNGALHSELCDRFSDIDDDGRIDSVVRATLTELDAQEVVELMESELEDENYHSIVPMPRKLYKILSANMDAAKVNIYFHKFYTEGLFRI